MFLWITNAHQIWYVPIGTLNHARSMRTYRVDAPLCTAHEWDGLKWQLEHTDSMYYIVSYVGSKRFEDNKWLKYDTTFIIQQAIFQAQPSNVLQTTLKSLLLFLKLY